jgi:transcriptional regulator with PAS, ATPase and Fis domain
MEKIRILYVDDEPNDHEPLASICSRYFNAEMVKEFESTSELIYNIGGNKLYCVQNKRDAIKLIKEIDFDLAFIDFKLTDGDRGNEVGKDLNELHDKLYKRKLHQVMLTAYKNEQRIALQSLVFFDYLTKPIVAREFSETMDVFNSFYEELKKLQNEVQVLKEENKTLKEYKNQTQKHVTENKEKFENLERNIIGESEEISFIKYFILKYSQSNDNVLLIGETGTGKDLVAEAIHVLSGRKGEFVSVNCASLSEDLAASELFGHKKGAFTGAIETKDGYFKVADKGTIFLDEIDRTSLSLQAKILKVIEDKKIIKVGSTAVEDIDVRIIASVKPTALEKLGKSFLEDLFGRLQSLFPEIPPLSKRTEDIPELVRYFIRRIGFELQTQFNDFEKYKKHLEHNLKKELFTISEVGIEEIKKHNWDRNVRELRSFIENIYTVFVENKKGYVGETIDIDTIKLALNISANRPVEAEKKVKIGKKVKDSDIQKYLSYDELSGKDLKKRDELEKFLILINKAIEKVKAESLTILDKDIIESAVKINKEHSPAIYPKTISNTNSASAMARFKREYTKKIIAAIMDKKEREFENILLCPSYLKYTAPIRSK